MNEIKLYESTEIRSIWDNEKEEWLFSVVDVVGVLTESSNPRRYWSDLKRKMQEEEGADQLYDKIVQLKMKAPDGKMRETAVAGNARKDIEAKTGKPVITKKNSIDFSQLLEDVAGKAKDGFPEDGEKK